MTLRTWLGFLIGRADCIEVAARTRGTLELGFLFVLSAGLAREYDQEDLLSEPWHVLLPLGVSLVTSFLLYCLLQLFTSPPPGEPRYFWFGYRKFLGLYWLMAPMAWLYAFPAERLLNDFAAVQLNLWLLLLVSVWRVAMMTRIVQVLWKAPVWAACTVVAWFALSVALAALALSPTPILSIMGGVRLTAAERLIAETTMLLRVLFTLAWPIALLSMIAAWFSAQRFLRPCWLPEEFSASISLWSVAAASLVVFLGLLPFTQPEQMRRTHAERLLKSGRIDEGLDYITQLGLEKFPPYWDPPPRVTYFGRQMPDIGTVIERSLQRPLPSNLEKIYRGKLVNAIADLHREVQERLGYIRLLLRTPDVKDFLIGENYHHTLRYPLYSLPESAPERKELEKMLYESDEQIKLPSVPDAAPNSSSAE